MTNQDPHAIKGQQQQTWARGDYPSLATMIVYVAETLVDAADLQAGWTVLDVATGSGNAAIAAARYRTQTTGLDFAAPLLDRARQRAAAEGLKINFIEGDAENLPFPDASFDAVFSVFGSMFTPDQARTAAEIARVCKPRARIGLASWTPAGFVGQMFATVGRYAPPPPGLPPPMLWGTEDHLQKLFGPAAKSLNHEKRSVAFRALSCEDFVTNFKTRFGPMVRAFERLDPRAQQALESDLLALAKKFDRNTGAAGPVAIESEYLQTIIERA